MRSQGLPTTHPRDAGRSRHVLMVFQPQVGGVPMYVRTLGEQLLERGWRVTVIGPKDADVRTALEAAGASYEPCSMTRMPSPRSDAAAMRVVYRIARATGVDVVHAHSSKAGLLAGLCARACRIPCVYTPHAWSFQMDTPPPVRFTLAAIEVAAGHLVHRAVITVSEKERDVGLRWHVASHARIFTVATGIPAPVLPSRDVARAELGCGEHDPVVAWVGRTGAQKQPRHLGRVARELGSTVRVLALGTGLAASPEAQSLRDSGVVILPEDTPAITLYAAADLLVQTSAWEGLPLTILEAMTAGVPVVAYSVGGVPELVLDGVTGLLVAPQDSRGLATAVQRLLADDALRRRFGADGIDHVGCAFSLEGMVSGIENVYAGAMRSAA